MSQLRKYRSAPAVGDLSEIKPIIKSLEYQTIPYSFLDTANLKRLYRENKINSKIFDEILNWKKCNNFKLGAGFFSEIVNLLRVLHIVKDRKISNEEFDNMLEPTGPSYNEFISGDNKINVQELTEIGHTLCDLISKDVNKSSEFDAYLFWLFLRNDKMVPIWQILVANKRIFYDRDVSKFLKQIENDSFTINAFLRWSDYFTLFKIKHGGMKILDEQKVALRILHAVIVELNNSYISDEGCHVESLVDEITAKFHLSKNSLNLYNVLEIILKYDLKKSIEGSYTGRSEKCLPNFSKINKLKIRSKIEIFPQFRNISDTDLLSIISTSSGN